MKVPYTNTQEHTVHIDGKAIKSGDTRDVEETMIPSYQPVAQSFEPAPDQVTELLQEKVADIVAALPTLEEADFVRLAKMEEESEKPRTSLMKAMAAEEIRRANERIETEESADTVAGDQGAGAADTQSGGQE